MSPAKLVKQPRRELELFKKSDPTATRIAVGNPPVRMPLTQGPKNDDLM